LSTLCLGAGTWPEQAWAGALDNSSVGARAIAMGSAFTGIANDATAVYYNPAGLAFLPRGTHVEGYGYVSFTGFEYENAGALFESRENFPVPGLFAAHRLERLALGFGAYVPYGGGGTAYPDFMGSGIELENTAGIVALTAAAAYPVAPGLSLGAGVSMHVGVLDSHAPQAISQPVPALVDYESQYSGVSGWGWNVGLLYKASDKVGLGASVISPSRVRMGGEETARIADLGVETTSDSEIELGVPWYFTAGLGLTPRPGLTLGLTACWMTWGDEKEVVVSHATADPSRLATHYEDGYRVSLGAEYAASSKLTLRAGLKYVPGATAEGHLVPSANDVDVLVSSVGVGYRLGKALSLDLAAYHVSGRRTEQGQESFDQDHTMLVVGLRWGS
jgi:long-chain fatty acid transport protein